MCYQIKRFEDATISIFDEEEQTASIYTDNQIVIENLLKYIKEYKTSVLGCKYFIVPKEWVCELRLAEKVTEMELLKAIMLIANRRCKRQEN